jgi:hypothetical protein
VFTAELFIGPWNRIATVTQKGDKLPPHPVLAQSLQSCVLSSAWCLSTLGSLLRQAASSHLLAHLERDLRAKVLIFTWAFSAVLEMSEGLL